MTSYNTTLNTNVNLPVPTNDNTLVNILGINSSSNVNYITASSINPYNQTLNTTSNPTFNTTNVTTLTGPSNTLGIFTNTIEYEVTGTTTNATATTIFTLASTSNTNYYIIATVSAFCTSGTGIGGGGTFRQVKRVTNSAGTLTLSSTVENLTNTSATLSGISINITSSGTNILLQVTGLLANNIDWVAYIKIVYSS